MLDNINMNTDEFDEGRLSSSIPFNYPDEVESTEDRTSELLLHMVYLLLECKNPKLKLLTLCYSSGINIGYILGCENTITDIARKLGVSKQNFHKELKKSVTQLNLNPQHINGHKNKLEQYRYANFIKSTH